MNPEMNPSEVISQFINYLERSKKQYDESGAIVNLEDRKVQDFLHYIEFCDNCKERSKISTKLHISRSKRRDAKDSQLKLEKIAKFYADQVNKVFIKSLKRLIQEQKSTEEYLQGERHYNKKGGDASC